MTRQFTKHVRCVGLAAAAWVTFLLPQVVMSQDSLVSAPRDQKQTTESEEAVQPEWKFSKGQVFRNSLQIDESIETHIAGGQTVDVPKQRATRIFDYRWRVEDVDQDGTATIHVTFDRVRINSEYQRFEFDSGRDSPLASNALGREPLLYSQRGIKHSHFVIKVDPRGGVLDVWGAHSVPDFMQFTPGDLPPLPRRAVKIGETWQTAMDGRVDSDAPMGQCRITEVLNEEGQRVVRIEGGRTMRPPDALPGVPFQIETKSRFDLKHGRFLDERFVSIARVRNPGGHEFTITISASRQLEIIKQPSVTSAKTGEYLFVIEDDSPRAVVVGGVRKQPPTGPINKLMSIQFFRHWIDANHDNAPDLDELEGISTRFLKGESARFAIYFLGLEDASVRFELVDSQGRMLLKNSIPIKGADAYAFREMPDLAAGVYFCEFFVDDQHLVRVPIQVSDKPATDSHKPTKVQEPEAADSPTTLYVIKSVKASIHDGKTVVDFGRIGEVLRISQSRGDWLLVEIGPAEGWVGKQHVIRLQEAQAFFERAIREDPKDPTLRVGRARFLTWIAQAMAAETSPNPPRVGVMLQMALSELEKAIELAPQDPLSYVARAHVWDALQRVDKVISDASKAIELGADWKASLVRGTAHTKRQEFDLALADFDNVIRARPENDEPYVHRGRIRRMFGDSDLAIADYSKALRLNPQNVNAYLGRGQIYYESSRYESAVADLTVAIRLSPRPMLYLVRGSAYNAMENADAAIEDFTRVIKLTPGLAEAYTYRGVSWLKKQEPQKALDDFDEAIRLDSTCFDALLNRGSYWKQVGDFEKALADYRRADSLKSGHPRLMGEIAEILAASPDAKLRDGKLALYLAKQACLLSEWENADCLASLAAACAEVGDFESAAKWQRSALEIAPFDDMDDFRKRLAMYQNEKPFRLTARPIEELGR